MMERLVLYLVVVWGLCCTAAQAQAACVNGQVDELFPTSIFLILTAYATYDRCSQTMAESASASIASKELAATEKSPTA